MIVNTLNKIAVKCSECSKYTVADLNLFKLKVPTNVMCECGNSIFKVYIKDNKLIININCIACDDNHSYVFNMKDIIKKQLLILSCPVTGMEIAFLGKGNYVDKVVDRYMVDMYELLNYLGIIDKKESRIVK